jgi:membrane-bound lytic murein transglycosylase D
VLLAAGSSNILLPWDNAEVFQRNYEASTLARMATWTAWVAPSTMKVADAAKRVNMSEADFRAVNNIPPRMLIKAGSALLVPRSANMLGDVAAQVADNGTLDLSPEAVAKRKAAAKGSKHGKGTKTASAKDGKGSGKKQVTAKSDKKGKGDTKVAKK